MARQRITFQAVGNTDRAVAQAAAIHFLRSGLNQATINTFREVCAEAGIKVRVQGTTIQLVS